MKKKEAYDKVQNVVKTFDSVVFVNFHGLSVGETTDLRSQLHKDDILYTVAKKTIVKKALSDSKIDGEVPPLDGELALAYSKDLVAPARGIYEFQKTHKDNIVIIGGIFESRYMTKDEMTNIATIPPMEILRAQFVNLINSPIQGLAVALDQIAQTKEA